MYPIRYYCHYFIPRRIRIKNILIGILIFIIFIVFIDDHYNNNETSYTDDDNMDLYKRERFINHPKNIQIVREDNKDNPMELNKQIPKAQEDGDDDDDEANMNIKDLNNIKIESNEHLLNPMENVIENEVDEKNNVKTDAVPKLNKERLNINISYEFELPKLNANRLLTDDAYRKYIHKLFFKNDDEDDDSNNEIIVKKLDKNVNSSISMANIDNIDVLVKECDCVKISCKCCIHVNVTDLDFNHYSCVNITYDKEYKNFLVDVKNHNNQVYDTQLPLVNTPDLCLNSIHSQYCVLFNNFIYYKNTIAGCLQIKFKLTNTKTVLLDKHVGCFKLPSNSKLSWKEILFSNKTLQNIQNIYQNVGFMV